MFANSITLLNEVIFGLFQVAMLIQLERTELLPQIIQPLVSGDFASLTALFTNHYFLSVMVYYILFAAIMGITVSAVVSGFVSSAEYLSYFSAVEGKHLGIAEVMSNFTKEW